jgi:tetratricopeptide (TPR) repeat protein
MKFFCRSSVTVFIFFSRFLSLWILALYPLNESLAADPDHPVWNTAVIRHKEGKLSEAAQAYRQILIGHPNHWRALCNLSLISLAQGDFQGALALIDRGLEVDPNSAQGGNIRGQILLKMDRRVEALAQFEKVLQVHPENVSALVNLGTSYMMQGDLDGAETLLQAAIRSAPQMAQAQANLGLVLNLKGDYKRAVTFHVLATQGDATNADSFVNLGDAFKAIGQTADALVSFERALTIDPNHPKALFEIGLANIQKVRGFEGSAQVERALELGAGNPDSLFQLAGTYVGNAMWERALETLKKLRNFEPGAKPKLAALLWEAQCRSALHHREATLQSFREAFTLFPNEASVWLHYGNFLVQDKRPEEAEVAYKNALRLRPGFGAAVLGWVDLLKKKLSGADLAALRVFLNQAQRGSQDEAVGWFALGTALDAKEDYRGAAEAFARAHALLRQWAPSPGRSDAFTRAVRESLSRPFFQRNAAVEPDDGRQIFIFGLPRSGTTLVQQIIGRDPKVYTGDETKLMESAFRSVPWIVGRPHDPIPEALQELTPGHLQSLRQLYLNEISVVPADMRFSDKMHGNYYYLGLIAAVFPRAKLIHCRRNLKDVALSCWVTPFSSVSWAHHPDLIADHVREYLDFISHWRDVLPERDILEVDYENLVTDFEGVARRIYSFLDLSWDGSALQFYLSDKGTFTSSKVQVRQPIYNTAIGRASKYEKLGCVSPILSDLRQESLLQSMSGPQDKTKR